MGRLAVQAGAVDLERRILPLACPVALWNPLASSVSYMRTRTRPLSFYASVPLRAHKPFEPFASTLPAPA